MAVRYHYLALEDDHRLVVDWFASLTHEMVVDDRSDRRLLYFRSMAKDPLPQGGTINQKTAPFVFIEKPQIRRGTLRTDSEVYFSATPLKAQFPELHKISTGFLKWLRQYDLVFSNEHADQPEWRYYLEGGIQNYASELYALPGAMAALRKGQYFIHHRDSDGLLSTLSKALALRGYKTENEN